MAKSPLLLPNVDTQYWQQNTLFTTAQQNTADALWLAIYFPKLAIEIAPPLSSNAILVAVEHLQGRTQVHTASKQAEEKGIFSGMAINAAYSLCPNIEVVRNDPDRHNEYLKKIAAWAGQFTSKVSIVEASTLILEVLGSAKLFGGLDNLLQTIRKQLYQRWSFSANFAVSPTPAASILLASVNALPEKQSHTDIVVVRTVEELRSRLGDIRLSRVPLTKKVNKQLHRLGLLSVRDLLRLPKADIARRYGQDVTRYLDKLLGVLPDPQRFEKKPEVFRAVWPLAFETKNTQIISAIVAQLLQRLQIFLQQRDACLSRYDVYFEHVKKNPTVLTIRFRRANRDSGRFLLLFEQRLQQCRIDTAVIGIQLFADKLEKFTSANENLIFSPEQLHDNVLQHEDGNDTTINQLLELLQVRLGVEAINSLHVCADHRPDCAYRFKHQLTHLAKQPGNYSANKDANSLAQVTANNRPLWLLLTPQQLIRRNKILYYQTALNVVSGPERIESAWWATEGMRRDYYIAVTKNQQTLWIYQELCKPYLWYLHGFFA